MDPNVLLGDELKYELEIRGLLSSGKAAAQRTRLEDAVERNQPLVNQPQPSAKEFEELESKLLEIEVAITRARSKKQRSLEKYELRLLYL